MLFYDVSEEEDCVLQFTIGDVVMSVASEVDRENWKASDDPLVIAPPTRD